MQSLKYRALQKPYYLNNSRSVLVSTLLAYYYAVIYRRYFDFFQQNLVIIWVGMKILFLTRLLFTNAT